MDERIDWQEVEDAVIESSRRWAHLPDSKGDVVFARRVAAGIRCYDERRARAAERIPPAVERFLEQELRMRVRDPDAMGWWLEWIDGAEWRAKRTGIPADRPKPTLLEAIEAVARQVPY